MTAAQPAPTVARPWFYYLHTNGDLIGKPPTVVDRDPDYFDSPFVRHVWRVDLANRLSGWRMLAEAARMGANTERVRQLARTWGINREDLPNYLAAEHDAGGVTRERADALRALLGMLGIDMDQAFDEIARGEGVPTS